MKKIFVLIGILGLITCSSIFYVSKAEEKQHLIIYQTEANVTGDIDSESVMLSGVKKGESPFYEDIKITVFDEKSGRLLYTQIPTINCGFSPNISAVDFDGDGLCEIFYSAQNASDDGCYYVYNFSSENAKTLYDFEVDASIYFAKYQNYYKACVSLLKKEVSVDLSHKGKDYLSKLYAPDGRLYKQALATVSNVNRVYTLYKGDKHLLVAVRKVTGENLSDLICSIVTAYNLNNGAFEIESSNILQ